MFTAPAQVLVMLTLLGLVAWRIGAHSGDPVGEWIRRDMDNGSIVADEDTASKSDAEWQQELSAEQYDVLRCSATEDPFTGAFWNHHEDGAYVCAGCGAELFSSEHKYDSGSGWPSFWQAIRAGRVGTRNDPSMGMVRTEVHCAQCNGHLGHVFKDGPEPSGLRYCINSAALKFKSAKGN